MHSSGLRILLKTVLGLSVARSAFGLTFGFPYGQEKVRGVNLGGWLVLEVSIHGPLLVLRVAGSRLERLLSIPSALDYPVYF